LAQVRHKPRIEPLVGSHTFLKVQNQLLCTRRNLVMPFFSRCQTFGQNDGSAIKIAAEPACTSKLVSAAQLISNYFPRAAMQAGPEAPDSSQHNIFDKLSEKRLLEVKQLALQDMHAERAVGALVGLAVADSVGAMLEFLPVGKKGSSFNPRTLTVTGEFNKFGLKSGQWTDDTSMSLCMADSLLTFKCYNGSDIRVRFWNWWNRGYNNAFRYDTSRQRSVGLGGNISKSLRAITNSQPPDRFDSDGEDAGNGSLMRLAPIPIFYHADIETAVKMSVESSYTTHPGPHAADACGFLGFIIASAITHRRGQDETAARFLDQCVEAYLNRPEVHSQSCLVRLLQSSEPIGSKERCWNWRDPEGPFITETLAARGLTYNGYPVSLGYFGSYCMDGLALALHSVYHTKSFMEALTLCVNFLGDADSTGAICGQIAGAYYGFSAIDERLVKQLQKWDRGEVSLRGALLYALGLQSPVKADHPCTGESSLCADGPCLKVPLPPVPDSSSLPAPPPPSSPCYFASKVKSQLAA